MMSQKKTVTITVLVMLGLTIGPALISTLSWPREGEYTGVFICAFEQEEFRVAGGRERWELDHDGWVVLQKALCADVFERRAPWDFGGKPTYRIRVYGKLSPWGHYGRFNRSSRRLAIEKVIECKYLGSRPPIW